jgi:hypothetical protein
MITEFTYTQAKAIIKEIGKFEIKYYSDGTPEERYGMAIINPLNGEKHESYAICTEEEADEAWEESLDSYLEDCIYPDLPGNLKFYFDDEKWKNDAHFDGRGHALSSYDGYEIDIADLVMFRIN